MTRGLTRDHKKIKARELAQVKFERYRKNSFLLTSSHFLLWPATNKPMHDEDEEEEKEEEEEETSWIVVAIR